jgi:DNA-binding beta-propeller fold protein YncE
MLSAKTSLALAASSLFLIAALQTPAPPRIVLGDGQHRYEWVRGWGELPAGMTLGNTHGCVLVDAQGRVYLNTDTENAVIVFSPEGKFLKSWGKELAGGLHGMALVREGDKEFLYLTHTERHEVLKATLDGEILWTIPWPEKSGVYASAAEFKPTSVAVTASGEIYVADGYGKSWIHEFDAKREYVRSWGGPGSEVGKLATPHGLWLDTRGEKPVLLVADRENHRLQSFDLDGKPLGVVASDLRRPCHLHQRGSELVVADLGGRITLLDGKNQVIEHLGDNPDPSLRAENGVPREKWRDGEFLAPHCACFDSAGNLYVVDWNHLGRITKLARIDK